MTQIYYIIVFRRYVELCTKIGRTYKRPKNLKAAKMYVNKYWTNLEDKTIYIATKYNQGGHVIEYKKAI